MRSDLDKIKIDENGDFDVETLSTWGTGQIITILQSTSLLMAEDQSSQESHYLFDIACPNKSSGDFQWIEEYSSFIYCNVCAVKHSGVSPKGLEI